MTDTETLLTRAAGLDLLAKGFTAAEKDNKALLAREMPVGDRRGIVLPLAGKPVKVATATHVNGSDPRVVASVADQAAFLEWVRVNRPDAVVTTVSVAPWFEAETLQLALKTGEVVPGVVLDEKAGSSPYVKVERVKTDEARAALLGAIFADNASGLRALLAAPTGTETTE